MGITSNRNWVTSSFALILSAAIFALAAIPSEARTIKVNTTRDVITPKKCSLRAAVDAANTNTKVGGCPAGDPPPTVDVIRLRPGLYKLTKGSSGENANTGGDLDVTESVEFRGTKALDPWKTLSAYRKSLTYPDWRPTLLSHHGSGLSSLEKFLGKGGLNSQDWRTYAFLQHKLPPRLKEGMTHLLSDGAVVANGIGKRGVLGDGDRVFDVAPEGQDGVDVTFKNLGIVYGDVGCTDPNCETGAGGVQQGGDGALIFKSSVIAYNTISCQGFACGKTGGFPSQKDGAGAIMTIHGGDLTMRHTAMVANRAQCLDDECAVAKAALDMQDGGNFIAKYNVWAANVGLCRGIECSMDEVFHWVDPANDPLIATALFDQVVVAHNVNFCDGKTQDCETDELLEPRGFVSLTMRDITAAKNLVKCLGFGCDTDEILNASVEPSPTTYTMERMKFLNNHLICFGENCDTDEVLDEGNAVGLLSIKDLEMSGTIMFCKGTKCDVDDAYCIDFGTHSDIRLTHNTLFCIGRECNVDETADLNNSNYDGLLVGWNVQACRGDLCITDDAVRAGGDTIKNAKIIGNISTCSGVDCMPRGDDGGGMLVTSEMLLEDSLIKGNHTIGNGGGISINDNATLTMKRTHVTKNHARVNGGGIRIEPDGELVLEDSSVTFNVADGTGGGVFNEGMFTNNNSVIAGNKPNQCVGC